MNSPSPADTEEQFEIFGEHPSNLDRCNRCGAPRSAHGPDLECPPRPAHTAVWVLLAAGSVLTLAGLIAQVTAPNDAAVAAILIGVTLLVAGVIMARRLR
jgi:hypothetical protein